MGEICFFPGWDAMHYPTRRTLECVGLGEGHQENGQHKSNKQVKSHSGLAHCL